MLNTEKIIAQELASLLSAHGVRRVFVSPGSRNAPLIVAIARCPQLETTVVVDERCAAFMAMGFASVANQPVALVCTSGTALLNYAPAVAEAFYRKVPLIVVSADRPMEWIDQDDSQTLRQPGALSNYVKLSCDIPEITTPNLRWYANRKINDAILAATSGRKAPVHINIQLDAPLGAVSEQLPLVPRTVSLVMPRADLPAPVAADLAQRISSHRVMVIAGFLAPDPKLNRVLESLASMPNVIVLTETIANLHSPSFISRIDTTLSAMDTDTKAALVPDIVITIGGALVSRFVKEYLRSQSIAEHWHIGVSHTTIDCFQKLTLRVELDPYTFFSQVARHLLTPMPGCDYATRWHAIASAAIRSHDAYISAIGWSDMKAFSIILEHLPQSWNLQLSNGTPIRYAQLFGDRGMHRTDCNRGVSGIDGCTSTAVGASLAYEGTTLLITGDMSAQYDVGALVNASAAPGFKMIVMCNGGGGIFRFIKSTSKLAELEEYFAVSPCLPLCHLARGYGLGYFQADSEQQLDEALPGFIASTSPAILAVYTDPAVSASTLTDYFVRQAQNNLPVL